MEVVLQLICFSADEACVHTINTFVKSLWVCNSKVTKKKDNTALSDRKYDSAKKKAPLTKQHSRNNLGQMVEKVQTPVVLNTDMSESS